jgi:hypothetical protein
MRDFEGSSIMTVSADRLFNYLADVRHLPDYFPKAVASSLGTVDDDDDDLSIVLDLGGEAVELRAWFRVAKSRRMLQWGVPETGYQGWIAVTPYGSGCELTVHVQGPVDDPDGVDDTDAEIRDTINGIRNVMSRTLAEA